MYVPLCFLALIYLFIDSILWYFGVAMRLFPYSKLSDCLFAMGLYANKSHVFVLCRLVHPTIGCKGH